MMVSERTIAGIHISLHLGGVHTEARGLPDEWTAWVNDPLVQVEYTGCHPTSRYKAVREALAGLRTKRKARQAKLDAAKERERAGKQESADKLRAVEHAVANKLALQAQEAIAECDDTALLDFAARINNDVIKGAVLEVIRLRKVANDDGRRYSIGPCIACGKGDEADHRGCVP